MISICGGNERDAMYLIKCYAHMIQKPTSKIAIGIVIQGRQGCGKKSSSSIPIAKIIGSRHYITSDKISSFFGEHAEGFVIKGTTFPYDPSFY